MGALQKCDKKGVSALNHIKWGLQVMTAEEVTGAGLCMVG